MNMKFTRTICAIAVCIATCLGIVSCDSKQNDPELKYRQQILNAFVYANDMAEDLTIEYLGANYDIIYDFIAGTADVTIQGLRLPGNKQYPTITLTAVPFTIDDNGSRVLEGSNMPVAVEGFATAPVFSAFKLTVADRYFTNDYKLTPNISEAKYYSPQISILFTIDGHYRVVSSLPGQVFIGTTVTTDSEGKSFSNSDPTYVLTLDMETKTGNLTINGAKFIQNMPEMTMTFPNIPFTVSNTGTVTLQKADPIIPTIGGTPFSAFPISNFKAVYTLTTGMTLDFVCTKKNQETGLSETYSVSADLPFFDKN